MKKIILTLFLLISCATLQYSQTLKIMTYNIRYDNPDDGENKWQFRKGTMAELIRFHEPDIFGIQEGLANQLTFLDSALPNYKHIGIGRDANGTGEHSCIFYNAKRFKLIKQATFWLSETPDVISKGWDAALNRICTYGLFKDELTKQHIWVFNTHFDYQGDAARMNSAKLIYNKINTLNKEHYPVILTGDFNLEPESAPIKFLSGVMIETKFATSNSFGNQGTFNNFEFDKPVTSRIDYIFTSKTGLKTLKYGILSDSKNCHYPSDHLPVFAELKYTGKAK
jgi:endonuclease/exonuclease/phosphatase family metal-dependent hydrolase